MTRLPFRSKVPINWDAVQYILGVRHFDVATHQPHPPGNPLYIFLGKGLHQFIADPNQALIALSIISSLLAVLGTAVIGRKVVGPAAGLWAAALVAANPLFWFYGEVALSYVPEIAIGTFCALAAWHAYRHPGRWPALWLGIVFAIAGGIRPTVLPLLALLWLFGLWRLDWKDRAIAVLTTSLGCLVWAIPLVMMTGGPLGYWRQLHLLTETAVLPNSLLEGPSLRWLHQLWDVSIASAVALNLFGLLILWALIRPAIKTRPDESSPMPVIPSGVPQSQTERDAVEGSAVPQPADRFAPGRLIPRLSAPHDVSATPFGMTQGLVSRLKRWKRPLPCFSTRAIFLSVWLIPPLAEFTLVCFGQWGYLLLILPPALLLGLLAIERLASLRSPLGIGMLSGAIAVCLLIFLAMPAIDSATSPFQPTLAAIRANDATWISVQKYVDSLPAERTVILTSADGLHSFRIASYMLPRYDVIGVGRDWSGGWGTMYHAEDGRSTYHLDPKLRAQELVSMSDVTYVIALDEAVIKKVPDRAAWSQLRLADGAPMLARAPLTTPEYLSFIGNQLRLVSGSELSALNRAVGIGPVAYTTMP